VSIQALRQTAHRLEKASPQTVIRLHQNNVSAMHHRLQRSVQGDLNTRLMRLKSAGGQLNALSPLATLNRGYSILRDAQQRIIQSADQAYSGQRLSATLADGELNLIVEKNER
jgi:exodeoxyribonuclease VII large subunit